MLMKASEAGVKTAQKFLGVETIQNHILYTQDKYLFTFLLLYGPDNSLLDEADNIAYTERLSDAMAEEVDPWQLLCVPRAVDTDGMLRFLEELRQETDKDARLRLLDGEAASLEELQRDGAKEPMILLKIWKKARLDADKELLHRAEKLQAGLDGANVPARLLEDEEIRRLCRIYGGLDTWQQADEGELEDIPILAGQRRRWSVRRESPEEVERLALLDEITPVGGLFFHPGGLTVGSALCRIYGAVKYPAELPYGWAASLMGATDCITAITYDPRRSGDIGDALSKSIRQSTRDANSQKDARQKKIYERKAKSADALIDDLDERGMTLGHMSIVVMAIARDEKHLEKVSGDVISRFAGKRIRLRLLSCVQKEAFRHLSPYYPNQPLIDEMLQRIVPLESLMGGYPMTASLVRDDHGLYFARTTDGGIISLDLAHKDEERPNGNGIVTGVSGIGKSTVLKHLIQTMYMRGVRVIVIDPESEFLELCKALDGSWWDAGGGATKINLLQIDPLPEMTKESETSRDIRPPQTPEQKYSKQLQYVTSILRYKFRSLTDKQVSLLERALRQLYADFGIDKATDTTGWEPEQFPVVRDLYELLLRLAQQNPDYEDLALLLESMAIGSDEIIWNGHTNLNLDNPLVVIDTSQLRSFGEETQAAQYYNLLHLCLSIATKDRDTPYLIVADEAQILMNPRLPEAAKMVNDMELHLRKYEGFLWLAFHNLHQMLDDRIRKEGQAILDTATYKILMGTDGKNLQDTVELFGLTQAQRKMLERKRRKKALVFIGARRLSVEFKLPQYKLQLMGKGGGK